MNADNPWASAEDAQSEFKLHLAIKAHYESCFIGAHNPNLKIFHIANESRDSTQGHFNKMLGQLRGVSDLMAGWPYNTGVCEIKLAGGKLTADQNRFLSWAHIIGWHTGVARSVKQFHEVAIKWGLKAAHHNIQEPDFRSKEQKFRDCFEMQRPLK